MGSKTYVVSGHGGAWHGNMFVVPAKATIYFYVKDNQILSDKFAWNLLGQLRTGRTPKYNWKADPGDWIPKYYCWNYPEIGNDCGIFNVRTGNLKIDLSKYDAKNALSLAEIIEQFMREDRDVYIHWLACTVQSYR